MTKARRAQPAGQARKPLVWLHGEVKTPPFTAEGRQEAGMLLRLLQEGENPGMPQAEVLPDIGPRCGALRVRDAEHNWRIMYRIDADAVLILEVYPKKTRKIPDEVTERCKKRLKRYDSVVRSGEKNRTEN
jgi:phage-related protein